MLRGLWEWDRENKGLKYVCKSGKIKDTVKEEKPGDLQSKTTEKEIAWKSEKRLDSKGNVLNISDIKVVVVEFLQRNMKLPRGFTKFVSLPLIDEIIMWTLRYFYYYFEIRSRKLFITSERVKPNQLGREYTLSEVQVLGNVCLRTLGEKYCNLLMGVDSTVFHHLKGGKAYTSSTIIDRNLYEIFYTFLTDMTWFAFLKKDYDSMAYEINRLFRSDEFNFYKPPPSIIPREENKTRISRRIRRSPLVEAVLSSLGKDPTVNEGYHIDSYSFQEEPRLPNTYEELKAYIEIELEFVGILGQNRDDFDTDLELIE